MFMYGNFLLKGWWCCDSGLCHRYQDSKFCGPSANMHGCQIGLHHDERQLSVLFESI